MEIWIVLLPFSSGILTDKVYHRCLGQVDVLSQTRVKRFYHREDSWRSLTGMLLPRALLRKRNVPPGSVKFSRTDAGKPFMEISSLSPAMGYNISHDNAVVAMASHEGAKEDVDKIGIDIMKRALPKGETVTSFLRAIEDTLTHAELSMFTPDLDGASAVRYIFLLWTLKEAYTKALGLGLGFDFKRIEYDITEGCVSVDRKPVQGWEFLLFTIQDQGDASVYQGAAARWIGGDETKMEVISRIEEDRRFHLKELTELMDQV